MKKPTKKLALAVSALAVLAVLGGCSSNRVTSEGKEYNQTHQRDEITHVVARMHQMQGSRAEMGRISFRERESGLQMRVELKNTRPNQEYLVFAYEIARGEKDPRNAGPLKTKAELNLPRIESDRNGNIDATFMIAGVTAAQLNEMKIVISREEKSGDMVKVGWGILGTRSMF
ncbi:MAG: YgdI/YgdR family lipoprotein [Alphaproteobacteria bacterium]|nr:YgdI/YgdR family lipoprotein [Alphaproteobacteria bacterium]